MAFFRTVSLSDISPAIDGNGVTLRWPSAGDFTAWVPIEMPRGSDGTFSLIVEMQRGGRWRYQFRVDDLLWINDPAADDYENTPRGGATSLLYT